MNDFKPFKDWLKQVSFLTEEDCALFEPYLKIKKYSAKEHFLNEGKTCQEIGFINRGSFRTYYLSDGKEINTHFVFENDFVVDYDSFLEGKPSKYAIQALEDVEIVTFNLEALQKAYNQSQNWERFGRIMAEQSYKLTTQRVESFLFLDGERRYLDLQENHPLIFDRIPLYHIASYLGMERESLSRLRKKIAGK
ncbi:Crp/Fnr family transcriptional regulator [Fluviicola taffensis]|uniref:Crp/Fnr family transcriptional regulator n=1 Tax=Fluviicola taffensis TaxID=191579 RepID=UPI003137BD40